MSTVPPVPPGPMPPPPPPPPGAMRLAPLPWEMRQQLGFVEALIATVKLFVTAPQEAWARTREKGDLVEPLIFGVILSWVGLVFSSIYGMFIGAGSMGYMMSRMPPEMRARLGPYMAGGGGVGAVMLKVILGPILIVIGLFLGAAILHVCFMIVGGLAHSTAGFEGTFRIVCYSSVAALAQAIPMLGSPVAGVWRIVLIVFGAVILHRMTTGKAVAGVLLPVILCCVCSIAFAAFLGSLIFGAMHR